jgi:hypothetical protein
VNKHVWIALSVLLCACSDDFDPGSLVAKLRLLAVSADKPFALPGDSVHLEALAYDPQARAISWGWGTCEADESTSAVDCLRNASTASLRIGAQTEFDLQLPQTAASYVGVVVVACPGSIVDGVTETIPIACVDAQGNHLALDEFELGMKRIFLRDSNLNHNPQIQAVQWNDADWSGQAIDECAKTENGACSKYAEHEVRLRVDGANEDSVNAQGTPIREQSVVQFYATGGEFEDDVKLVSDPVTKWHAKREDAGKAITFWFVVRDDRGGVSWVERTMQVP